MDRREGGSGAILGSGAGSIWEATGSVLGLLDLLYQIDDSTPWLTIANPHERLG
jgi:hypothetical protein